MAILKSMGLTAVLARLSVLLSLGAQHSADATVKRKIMQTNVGMLLTVVNILTFNLLFVLIGNPALIYSGLVQLPVAMALAVGVPLLNHQGRLTSARWLLFVGVALDVNLALLGAQGTALYIHWYFLVVAVVSTAFFPARQWRHTLLISMVSVGFFCFYQIHGWPPADTLTEVSAGSLLVLQTTMVSSCAMVVVVLILFSEHFAERNELELQLMADTDALTQLPNRRAFRARLGRALEAAERDGGQIAVALLDVDFFKHVNDTYGHDAGDMCLQTLARLLQGELRADDVVARMGGEEFALLMPQTTLDQARVIAERMRAVVARHAFALAGSDELLSVQISIGLAALTPGERVDQAMKAADDALYRAKASGRNRVVVQAGGG